MTTQDRTTDRGTAAGQPFGRRTLLGGGLVALGVVALSAAPAQAMVSRNVIGNGSYQVPTRYRTAYSAHGQGQIGVHPSQTAFSYNETFYSLASDWVDTYHSCLLYMSAGAVGVSYVGSAGVYVDKPGNHGTGNAFDVTAIHHTDGSFVDCNYSWHGHAGTLHNRRYAAVGWSGRKHLTETGNYGTGGGHDNHIHIGRYKNGTDSLLLSRSSSWDTYLVQHACQAFMGVDIAIDGQWGPQTDAFFADLMSRLGYAGRDPFSNVDHLVDLAHTLTAHGTVGNAI